MKIIFDCEKTCCSSINSTHSGQVVKEPLWESPQRQDLPDPTCCLSMQVFTCSDWILVRYIRFNYHKCYLHNMNKSLPFLIVHQRIKVSRVYVVVNVPVRVWHRGILRRKPPFPVHNELIANILNQNILMQPSGQQLSSITQKEVQS